MAAVLMVFGLYCSLCLITGTIIRYEVHNFIVENSPEYRQVINDVMREVYTTFAEVNMENIEMCLNEEDEIYDKEYYQEEKQKLEEAKELIDSHPEKAAELFNYS